MKNNNDQTTYYRPVLIIKDLSDSDKNSERIKRFIYDNNIKILNVCGNRQSNLSSCVKKVLIDAILPELIQ